MSFLIGLDVGTTNTKAVAFDPEAGVVAAVASRPTPYVGAGATREIDPAQLWEGVAACLRQVQATVRGPVLAIGVASMGEAGVPLDAAGQPLFRVIPWYDFRTEPQLRRTLARVDADALFRITGQATRHVYALYKLQWLREHAPAAFRALALWLSISDFVVWRLTGEAVTDYSLASRTMLLDQRRRAWSPEMLHLAEVREDQLPSVRPAGVIAGRVTAAAAGETALPIGVPVAVGGHDHLCGALAAGASAPGEVVDSIGTAESIMFPVADFRDDEVLAHGRICCYAHVVPDRFVVQGGMAMGGGSLPWIAARLFDAATDPVASALDAAATIRPGAGGLLYYPYLGGNGAPVGDENVAGGFVGLRPEHERGHLVRAVLEGVAFGVRHTLEATGEIVGPAVPPIRVVGGGSRSPLWLRIRASVIGEALEAVDVPEAVAVGAALLAGVGAGVFGSPAAAVAAVRRATTIYEPDLRDQERYDDLYHQGYRQLYPALRAAFAGLARFASDPDT